MPDDAANARVPLPRTERDACRPLVISSARLFGGVAEIQIEHRGAVYRLKQTSLGKLILTK